MKRQTMIANGFRIPLVLLTLVLFTFSARSQTGGNGTSQPQASPEVVERSGYVIHQSVEIGYRVSDQTGSEQMYNSLVNLRTGPRFLEQSLSMQSQTHDTPLFDN